MNCYLHPDRPAAGEPFNVPCALGGKIHVCAECHADPDVMQKVWNKYKGEHAARIDLFKTPGNPGN